MAAEIFRRLAQRKEAPRLVAPKPAEKPKDPIIGAARDTEPAKGLPALRPVAASDVKIPGKRDRFEMFDSRFPRGSKHAGLKATEEEIQHGDSLYCTEYYVKQA